MKDARLNPVTGRSWAILGALSALAIVLRAIGLESGLWFDEISALSQSYRESLVWQVTTYVDDFHHPLYSAFARLSLVAFGESAWTIRLPAALFGAATIPLVYILGREVATEREGWIAAGFLAVFYPHVWFSQSARGYTMLAFWATLATLLLVRALRRSADPGDVSRPARPAYGYAIVAGLGVFTHMTMIFLVVAHAVVLLVEAIRSRWDRRRVIAYGLTFVLSAVTTLLLYAPMLSQVIDFLRHDSSELVGVSTPLWALVEAVRVIQQGLGGGTLLGVAGAAGLFGLGVLSYARRNFLVLALFLTPGIVTLIGAMLARGTMYPRFFFFLVAFLVLILIRGTLVLGDWIGAQLFQGRPLAARIGPAIVGVMVLASFVGLAYNYRYPKQDYEGAIAFVESRATEADTILTTGDGGEPLVGFYGREYPLVETAEELSRLRSSSGRTWMVFTFPLYIEAATPDIMTAIDEGCVNRTVFTGTIGGGDLIVCSFPPTTREG